MTANSNPTTERHTLQWGPSVEGLISLAVAGLGPMFHPESELFCYRRKLGPSGFENEGLSPRYTIMSLLGLARHQATGQTSPIDVRAVLRRLLAGRDEMSNAGDLGLLLWLCASADPECVPEACGGLDFRGILEHSPEGRYGSTTELAWLLAGLSHVKLSGAGDTAHLMEAAFAAHRLLGKNQGPHGIFGHSAKSRSLAGFVRGHIGSFADQVYPIYALTKFGEAYGVEPAITAARCCAEAICQLQGPAGQWWWHYDARTGRVFERYPVYSVHQHAMAPMALFALGDATGFDYGDPIYAGLRWVTDTNELGAELTDREQQIIWRGIYRGSKWGISITRALGLLGREDQTHAVEDLLLRAECRPYELGWLLYAFSGRTSPADDPQDHRACRTQ